MASTFKMIRTKYYEMKKQAGNVIMTSFYYLFIPFVLYLGNSFYIFAYYYFMITTYIYNFNHLYQFYIGIKSIDFQAIIQHYKSNSMWASLKIFIDDNLIKWTNSWNDTNNNSIYLCLHN